MTFMDEIQSTHTHIIYTQKKCLIVYTKTIALPTRPTDYDAIDGVGGGGAMDGGGGAMDGGGGTIPGGIIPGLYIPVPDIAEWGPSKICRRNICNDKMKLCNKF
jgi:hypothetical protein